MEPIVQSPLAIWQAYLRAHQLAYQWSPDANRAVFYPRVVCPFGGKLPLEWRISDGLGCVYATTQTAAAKGEPYNVALVDLDEGFRVMSLVEGATGDISEIGRRVRLKFVEADNTGDADGESPLPVFIWEDTK